MGMDTNTTTKGDSMTNANIHNVNFTVVANGFEDFRVEFYEGDRFYTEREFKTLEDAKAFKAQKEDFYSHNTGAYLFTDDK